MSALLLIIRGNIHIGALPGDIVVVSVLCISAAKDFTQAAHVAVSYTGVFGFDECSSFLDGGICYVGCFKHCDFSSSADKRRTEIFVDFPDFLYAVDIRLINAFDPAATAVIASGAEFAVYSACAPESLMNNADSFFSCGIFDQDGGHCHTSPFTEYLNYVYYITIYCQYTSCA